MFCRGFFVPAHYLLSHEKSIETILNVRRKLVILICLRRLFVCAIVAVMAVMGRPTVEHPRNSTLSIRLADDERSIIDAAAQRAGKKPAAWARDRLLAAAKRQP